MNRDFAWICRVNISGVYYDTETGPEREAEDARTNALDEVHPSVTVSVINLVDSGEAK